MLMTDNARRILIVDSYQDAADSLAILLEMSGHEVRVAYTPDDALNTANDFAPDTVLLEIILPKRDGFDLGQELRDRQGCKVVVYTGYYTPASVQQARRYNCLPYLLKPVDADTICGVVDALPTLVHNCSACPLHSVCRLALAGEPITA